jgi:hypothetical protein
MDYSSKAKSSNFYYVALPIGTVFRKYGVDSAAISSCYAVLGMGIDCITVLK